MKIVGLISAVIMGLGMLGGCASGPLYSSAQSGVADKNPGDQLTAAEFTAVKNTADTADALATANKTKLDTYGSDGTATDPDYLSGDDTDDDRVDGEILSPAVVQTQEVLDLGDGNPSGGGITPTAGIARARRDLTCYDADGCSIALDETDMVDNQIIELRNVGSNDFTMSNITGVQVMIQPETIEQDESVIMQYQTDAWYQIGGNTGAYAEASHDHDSSYVSSVAGEGPGAVTAADLSSALVTQWESAGLDVSGVALTLPPIGTETLQLSELNDTSTPHLLTVAELKNALISNQEATEARECDFPARTESWHFWVIAEAAYTITLDPNGTENWYLNGVQQGAGTAIVIPAIVGSMAEIWSTEDDVFVKTRSAEINKLVIPFDPEKWYDNTTNNVVSIMQLGDEVPNNITITSWSAQYLNGDPATELDADLMCDTTPDFDPAANGTVMDVIDTTAGVSSASSGFDSDSCATGSNLYIRFGADPVDSGEIVHFEVSYTVQ